MNNLIILEGIDGCGKTTIGKELIEKLKLTFLNTPLTSEYVTPIRSILGKPDLTLEDKIY